MDARVTEVVIGNEIPAAWATDERGPEGRIRGPALMSGVEPSKKAGAIKNRLGELCCESCGRVLQGDERHEVVARVVKPGHRYGAVTGPAVVYVEEADLVNADGYPTPIGQILQTVERYNHDELVRCQPPERPKPRLLQLVEQGYDAALKQSKEMLSRAKMRVQIDADRKAQEAQDLARQTRAPADQEPPSAPRRAVSQVEDERLVGILGRLERLENENAVLKAKLAGAEAARQDAAKAPEGEV